MENTINIKDLNFNEISIKKYKKDVIDIYIDNKLIYKLSGVIFNSENETGLLEFFNMIKKELEVRKNVKNN